MLSRPHRQLESLASDTNGQFQAHAYPIPSPLSINVWDSLDLVPFLTKRQVRRSYDSIRIPAQAGQTADAIRRDDTKAASSEQ